MIDPILLAERCRTATPTPDAAALVAALNTDPASEQFILA